MSIGVAVVSILLLVAVGGAFRASRLPSETQAERLLEVDAPPERAFQLVADVARYPDWMKGVGAISEQPSPDGRPTFVERRGDRSMWLVIEEARAPTTVRISMRDSTGAYSARWEYRIEAASGGGASIRIRESAHLASAPFRVAVHLGGVDSNVRLVADALEKKLNAAP